MDDTSHIIPSQDSGGDKSDSQKESKSKLLVGIGVVIILLLFVGISYFLGTRQNATDQTQSPTPTQISKESPTPSEAEKISPTTTGVISPTKKPTPTKSPTSTPTPTVKTKIISSTAAIDGFRSSNGGGNNGLEVRAGRNIYLVSRGFVSFELSGIPTGATVTEATLRLYQAKIIGNPYGVGGSVKVDHLTYGDSLDDADYSAAALSSSFTTLTGNATLEWKDANVTDRVKDDFANGRSKSQFRVHFQIENTGGDATGDFAYFEAPENSQNTGNTPQLVVKYY